MSARLGLRTVASLPRRFGPSLWYLTELNNRSSRCLSYTQSRFATVQEEKRTPDYSKMSLPLKFMIRLIVGYRDYGLTALTFHAVCAGFSLGSIWYLIYNGYDVVGFLARLGFVSPFNLLLSHIQQAFGGSHFALAYSIHKAFSPVRVLITAVSTPFIVKRLRKEHIFKLPPGMRP